MSGNSFTWIADSKNSEFSHIPGIISRQAEITIMDEMYIENAALAAQDEACLSCLYPTSQEAAARG